MSRESHPGEYVFVSYRREGYEDVKDFEEELRTVAVARTVDIVIDLAGFVALSSPEIGVLVRVANLLKGSGKVVRIITSAELEETFTRTNLDKLSTIALFPSRDAAIRAVNNSDSTA